MEEEGGNPPSESDEGDSSSVTNDDGMEAVEDAKDDRPLKRSEEAAQQLGVGLTCLKRICRKHGVLRWPYRKLRSLDRLMCHVETGATPGDANQHLAKTAQDIRQYKEGVINGEASLVGRSIKRLHQACYKTHYKIGKVGHGPGARSASLPRDDHSGEQQQQQQQQQLEMRDVAAEEPSSSTTNALQMQPWLPPPQQQLQPLQQHLPVDTLPLSSPLPLPLLQQQPQQQQQQQQMGPASSAAPAVLHPHLPMWPSISNLHLSLPNDLSISLPPGGLLAFLESASLPFMLHSLPPVDLLTTSFILNPHTHAHSQGTNQHQHPCTSSSAHLHPSTAPATSLALLQQPPTLFVQPHPLAKGAQTAPQPNIAPPTTPARSTRRKISPFEAVQHAATQLLQLPKADHHPQPAPPPAAATAGSHSAHSSPTPSPSLHHHIPHQHNVHPGTSCPQLQHPAAHHPDPQLRYAQPLDTRIILPSLPLVQPTPQSAASTLPPAVAQHQPQHQPPHQSQPSDLVSTATRSLFLPPVTSAHHPPTSSPPQHCLLTQGCQPSSSISPTPPSSGSYAILPQAADLPHIQPPQHHHPKQQQQQQQLTTHLSQEDHICQRHASIPPHQQQEQQQQQQQQLAAYPSREDHLIQQPASTPHQQQQQHANGCDDRSPGEYDQVWAEEAGAAAGNSVHPAALGLRASAGAAAEATLAAAQGVLEVDHRQQQPQPQQQPQHQQELSEALGFVTARPHSGGAEPPHKPGSGEVQEAEAYASLQYAALQLGRVMRTARLLPLGLSFANPGHLRHRDLLRSEQLSEEQAVACLQLLALDLGFVLMGIELTALPRMKQQPSTTESVGALEGSGTAITGQGMPRNAAGSVGAGRFMLSGMLLADRTGGAGGQQLAQPAPGIPVQRQQQFPLS